MDHAKERHEEIDRLLRQAYENTEPRDSWPALRERIDTALSRHDERRPGGPGQVVFWRRTALALAACLMAATGLLLYVASVERRAKPAGGPALLTQAQIGSLIQAFAQVRSLFAEQQPWLMIDSAGNSQIGLTPTDDPTRRTERVIILRVTVQQDDGKVPTRYADLVAYPRQQISMAVPTAGGSSIEMRLVSTPREDGQVDIDFTARGDNGSCTGRITSVGQNAFTSLTQMQIGAHEFSLTAMAKLVPLSERG